MKFLFYIYGMEKQLKPSEKSKELEQFLEAVAGRSTAISNMSCVNPPFGCGKPVTSFPNDLYRREYKQSGLCPECQDKIFK